MKLNRNLWFLAAAAWIVAAIRVWNHTHDPATTAFAAFIAIVPATIGVITHKRSTMSTITGNRLNIPNQLLEKENHKNEY